MIIGKDINPKKEIYYLGGIVVKILKEFPQEEVVFFDAFQRVSEVEKVSINLFTLTLDWLFILGIITLNKGYIKKCF